MIKGMNFRIADSFTDSLPTWPPGDEQEAVKTTVCDLQTNVASHA